MTIDLTGFQTDTDTLLSDWGETVTIKRLTIDYDTVPPEETWATSTTVSMEIQQRGGSMGRKDSGLADEATHWGFADYNSGVLVNDRIYRSGDDSYYLVLSVSDLEDHLEVWMKYVQGAL